MTREEIAARLREAGHRVRVAPPRADRRDPAPAAPSPTEPASPAPPPASEPVAFVAQGGWAMPVWPGPAT